MICCPKTKPAGVSLGGAAPYFLGGSLYSNYVCVAPLDEDGDGTAGEYQDRTINNHDGTGKGNVPVLDSGAFCLPSQKLRGRDWIEFNFSGYANFSCSFLAKIDDRLNQAGIWFSQGNIALGFSFLRYPRLLWRTAGTDLTIKTHEKWGSTLLTAETFYHCAMSYNGTMLTVYVNGEKEFEQAAGNLVEPSTVMLGTFNNSNFPQGNIQEFRYTPFVLSDAWFEAEYLSYSDCSFIA